MLQCILAYKNLLQLSGSVLVRSIYMNRQLVGGTRALDARWLAHDVPPPRWGPVVRQSNVLLGCFSLFYVLGSLLLHLKVVGILFYCDFSAYFIGIFCFLSAGNVYCYYRAVMLAALAAKLLTGIIRILVCRDFLFNLWSRNKDKYII